MVFRNMMGLEGQHIVLDTTVDTYVKYNQFEYLGWASVSTLNERHAPSRYFRCNLMHWSASQVSPVSKDGFFCKKTGFSSHGGHETAADIDDTGKPKNGVSVPFFLSWISCGASWFSYVGLCIALAPCLSGGYVSMHKIDLDIVYLKICYDCVDKLCM